MKSNPHIIAVAVTVVAIIIFATLKWTMDFAFGFRTYWPAFVCIYLLTWYYVRVSEKGTVKT